MRPGHLLFAVLAATATAGCASSAAAPPGTVAVVASTSAWGDVVAQVAGSQAGHRVRITSIIASPSVDPHSYVADPRDQLALSRATLIVENGGGYDGFLDTLRDSVGTHVPVLNAVAISGRRSGANGPLNEHVWYDLPTVARVADRVAAALATADPDDAPAFRANAAVFGQRLRGLERREAAIRTAYAGTPVAITEPLPLYLLDACGLVNRTPAAFSSAVEVGNDVSARVLNQTLALFDQHAVRLVAYNEQTSGPVTQRVLDAAESANVPVVAVTETLPDHQHYLGWMAANLAALRSALAET